MDDKNTTPLSICGERIRNRRKALCVTQGELAAQLQISQAYVAKIEKQGLTSSYLRNLDHLAEILQCTPDYIMGYSDDPKLTKNNSRMFAHVDYFHRQHDISDIDFSSLRTRDPLLFDDFLYLLEHGSSRDRDLIYQTLELIKYRDIN